MILWICSLAKDFWDTLIDACRKTPPAIPDMPDIPQVPDDFYTARYRRHFFDIWDDRRLPGWYASDNYMLFWRERSRRSRRALALRRAGAAR